MRHTALRRSGRWFRVLRPAIVAALVLALAGPAYAPSRAAASRDRVPREILAFYYGWYGAPPTSPWMHWGTVDAQHKRIANTTDYPAGGPYDSDDPKLIERQAVEAERAGVTGFIVSWWGQGSHEDQGVPLLLAAARRHHLHVTIYDEKVEGETIAAKQNAALADLRYILGHYASDAAWLRIDDQPVLFLYGRALAQLPAEQWKPVLSDLRRTERSGIKVIADGFTAENLKVFDGLHTYNITGSIAGLAPMALARWAGMTYPNQVSAADGKISCLTVIPGFDDRFVGRPPPRPVTERNDGETYRILWQAAIAANPDWILITSWNEWHEGSEIEPSLQYGDRYLRETAVYARSFMARGRR
jgi:hypothetical protein